MRSSSRPLAVLVAALMMTACANSVPPVIAPQRPLPAAALQLCPLPPVLVSVEADEMAATLMDMYGLYGQCAGLHADLVQALEGRKQ